MAVTELVHLSSIGSQLRQGLPALAQGQRLLRHDEETEQKQHGSGRADAVFCRFPRVLQDFETEVLAPCGGGAGEDERFDPVRVVEWATIARDANGTSIDEDSSELLSCVPKCEV